jgi:hypothetical protein
MRGRDMTRSRAKHKGRADRGSFFAWPRDVADSAAYIALSAHGVRLLNDLCFQFRGSNNGDLTAAWRLMMARGWKSRDTLNKALRELLELGLIEKTRQGGRHRCNLFALTWLSIDECDGKLDVPATRVPSGLWKQPRASEQKNGSTPGVSMWPAERVNSRSRAQRLTRRAC